MTNSDKQSLGDLLRGAREARSYSRAKLAELTDLNPNSIAKYEKAGNEGGQFPPLEKLVKIAFVLKIDPRLIFTATAQEPEERQFFATLDDFMFKMNENMEKFMGGFIAVMGMAAKEELERGEGEAPVTKFLSKTYEGMKQEMEEKGEDIASFLMQNGPDQSDPSRPDKTINNPETAATVSTNPTDERKD